MTPTRSSLAGTFTGVRFPPAGTCGRSIVSDREEVSLANSVALFARGRRYICCNCNRVIFKSKAGNRKDKLCPHCGHEMVAARSVVLSVGFGLCWSVVLVAITAGAAKFLPVTSSTTIGVGLAICAALACNKLFLSSQHFRAPEPAASVSSQLLAEGVAAFVIVLVGGTILLR